MNSHFITITIPRKQWLEIWNENYPDIFKIMGAYYFTLRDSYGVAENSIYEFDRKLWSSLKMGDEVNFIYKKENK